jgi:hypothetical protein
MTCATSPARRSSRPSLADYEAIIEAVVTTVVEILS